LDEYPIKLVNLAFIERFLPPISLNLRIANGGIKNYKK
jgi:hypothetical protein